MTQRPLQKDRIAIIGLGKVGTAVGYLLNKAGYEIAAVYDQSEEALRSHTAYTGGKICPDPPQAAALADCILITTGDDMIAGACSLIAGSDALRPGCKVLHMSGAGGLDLLDAARSKGAYVASIHPIQSFPDFDAAVRNIPGSTFGITAQEEIKDWAISLVEDLGGIPLVVSEADKPLYHAAACMASNYLATLINMAETVYGRFGLKGDSAAKAFQPLIRGTLSNIESGGTIQALTGPIARGDAGTIRKHMQALSRNLPELVDAYRSLGILTVGMAMKKKSLSGERAAEILKILEGGPDHEHTG